MRLAGRRVFRNPVCGAMQEKPDPRAVQVPGILGILKGAAPPLLARVNTLAYSNMLLDRRGMGVGR